MSAEDAKYLIRDGWTKLAEWTATKRIDPHMSAYQASPLPPLLGQVRFPASWLAFPRKGTTKQQRKVTFAPVSKRESRSGSAGVDF
jgi:hypothetical protein